MRVIVNAVSDRVAGATGWRAREIRVDETAATLEGVFRSSELKDGTNTLYDLLTDDGIFRDDFSLFISGEFLRGKVDLKRPVRDSEQLHVWDWPFSTRDS